jgi:hypothetical protein
MRMIGRVTSCGPRSILFWPKLIAIPFPHPIFDAQNDNHLCRVYAELRFLNALHSLGYPVESSNQKSKPDPKLVQNGQNCGYAATPNGENPLF